VETKALDHAELGNQIIDVIVKEGMVDREDKFDVYIPMDGPFHEARNIGDLVDAIAAYIGKEKKLNG
jgi:acyl carrier protein